MSLEQERQRLGRALQGTEFGRYHVGRKIGQGGYAWVYRATDLELERDCALKVLLPRQCGYSRQLRERFLREAKLVGKLRDARSIRLYEADERDGLLYMVFEYVEGCGLDEVIEQQGALEPLRVVKILEQIMEALQDAHDLGIVHRDMKPGNVLLYEIAGRSDQVKVLDFGIGKFVNRQTVMDLTREGMVMGTPRYMSPEQLTGDATARSDIYSTGLVAYELLTGQHAVEASSPVELMAQVTNEQVRIPRQVQLPEGLRDIVHQMLRNEPVERYDTAGEVLEDLGVLRRQGRTNRQSDRRSTTIEITARLHHVKNRLRGMCERLDTGSRRWIVAATILGASVGVGTGWFALGGELQEAHTAGTRDDSSPGAPAKPVENDGKFHQPASVAVETQGDNDPLKHLPIDGEEPIFLQQPEEPAADMGASRPLGHIAVDERSQESADGLEEVEIVEDANGRLTDKSTEKQSEYNRGDSEGEAVSGPAPPTKPGELPVETVDATEETSEGEEVIWTLD